MALLLLPAILASIAAPFLAGAPAGTVSLVSSYRTVAGIASVDLSPNSSLLVVAERGGLVTVFNRTMSPLVSRRFPHPSYIEAKFVNDTLLAVIWSRDSTHLSLVDLRDSSTVEVPLLGNPAPLLASLPWRDGRILMLFKRALLLVDLERGEVVREGDVPFAIVNTGVTLFPINGSRLALLAVMTRCPLCLEKNEKVLIIFTPRLSVESSTTLNHVLAAYPRRNGTEIMVVKDNGYADIYYSSAPPRLKEENAVKIFTPGRESFVAGPGVMLVYSFRYGEGVYARISRAESLAWHKAFTPLTGVKPVGKTRAAVSATGFYAVLIRGIGYNYLIAGNPLRGIGGTAKLAENTMLGPVSGDTVVVHDGENLYIYSATTPEERYRVLIRIYGEGGEEIPYAELRVDGNATQCTGGVCTLVLRRGVYTALVEAPGYTPREVSINVSANTAVEVVLYKRLYRLSISVTNEKNEACNATVVVRDERGEEVYRGVAGATALLPGGSYTVEAFCGDSSNSTKIVLEHNASVNIVVPTGKYRLTVRLPEGVTAHVLVLSLENGEAAYNGTASGVLEVTLRGGRYLVEATAPGYMAYRREILLTRDTELDVTLEKISGNLTAVIYGLRGCPHCREVNASLHELIENIIFREISNPEYAAEYERLYRLLGAGEKGLVPLTLIFRGDRLIMAAVGGDGAEWWRSMLSKATGEKVLLVDDEGNIRYVDVNQSLIREIVLGRAPSRPGAGGEALLPLVISLAAADSVNPCTFLVFTALLVLTMRISGKKSMVLAAAAFIAAIYVTYLLLGLGLLKVFASLPWLKYVLAALAFAFGAHSLWSIRGGEFHSPVPQRWKEMIEEYLSRIARTGSPLLAFGLGMVISLTLLPCSSGPYLVAMYALARLPFYAALLYLLLYNAIFVAPLIGITALVAVASKKVRALMKTRTKLPRYFEALAGILLIAIGLYVLLYM